MVFGVIYCFGIKGGIGADSLSDFFICCTWSSGLGVLPVRCGVGSANQRANSSLWGSADGVESGRVAHRYLRGADETFYGLPILVAIELASDLSSVKQNVSIAAIRLGGSR
jgi:hypothetical protein